MSRVLSIATCLAAILVAGSASAQAIGDARFVRKDVRGIMAGRLVPVNAGDTVYRDQIIRTAADSSSVLVFLDKSSMAIGPQSEVRLDEFVFKSSSGPRTVDTVKGFFRFISGTGADAHDYSVRTPHATIAVRGTTFDVRVTEAGTTVVLHDGAVDVCSAGECRSLVPGQSVETRNKGKGMGDVRPTRPTDWTYGEAPKEQRAALEASRVAMDRIAAANGVRTVASAKAAAAAAASASLAKAGPVAPPAAAPVQADSAPPVPAARSAESPAAAAPAVKVEQPAGLTVAVAAPPAAQPAQPAEQRAPATARAVEAPAPPPPAPALASPPAPRAVAPAPSVVATADPARSRAGVPAAAQDRLPPLAVSASRGEPSALEVGWLGWAGDTIAGATGRIASLTAVVTGALAHPRPETPETPVQALLRAGPRDSDDRQPFPLIPERVNQAVIPNNKGDGSDLS